MNPQSDADPSTTAQFFLALIAQGCPDGLHVLVSRKTPTRNGGSTFPSWAWSGQPLTPGPWYFCTGASDDRRLRRAENVKAVRCIVIDDVGTKVQAVSINAAPSWRLETSQGNEQWGYLLDGWCTDIAAADALVAGMIAAGLQDKGCPGACRLYRIPGSINDKPGRESFVAELRHFDKDAVYTLDSLAKALGVTPGAKRTPRERPEVPPAAGQPDPVFEWLHENGYIIERKNAAGWWGIRCPFAEEHEGDPREDAKYMHLADSDDGKPHVWCYHSHGLDKATYARRFFQWVVDNGGPRTVIPVGAIDPGVQAVLRKAADALAPRKEVRLQPTPEPEGTFDFITLTEALGAIPKEILPHLDKTAEGHPKQIQHCSFTNVEAGLRHLGVQVRLNLMNGKTSYILPERIDLSRFGRKTPREIDDMVNAVLLDIFGRAGLRSKRDLNDCMARIANSLYWHPASDWIDSKPWDGKDRFQALCDTVTTDTPGLLKTYLRRWLLQCVEAACGWKHGRENQKALCFVLAGDQGIGKTRWLMSLAPGFCAEGKHLSLDGHGARDSKHEALQGMIVELGELDTTFKKTAVGSMKAFLSGTVDEYRLPYADSWLTRPRCTSFCGSVNERQFLQDVSGNRRFAAVWVDRCDPEHGVDMQQLWAQVHTWWDKGEPWWLTDEEAKVQTETNKTFQADDGIGERIAAELDRRQDRSEYPLECGLNCTDVARLLDLRYEHNGQLARVSAGLREHLGEHKNLRKSGGGAKVWIWWLTHIEAAGLGLKPLVRFPKP